MRLALGLFAGLSLLSATYSAAAETRVALIIGNSDYTSAHLKLANPANDAVAMAMNDSLSLLRAEYIQYRLEGDEPPLKKRTVASGVGSRENLIGTGRDDLTDMLDRRVELKPIEPCG